MTGEFVFLEFQVESLRYQGNLLERLLHNITAVKDQTIDGWNWPIKSLQELEELNTWLENNDKFSQEVNIPKPEI